MSLYAALGGGVNDHPPDWDRTERLSDAQVASIIELYRECGWRQVDIANHFGISQSFVSRIVNGKRRAKK